MKKQMVMLITFMRTETCIHIHQTKCVKQATTISDIALYASEISSASESSTLELETQLESVKQLECRKTFDVGSV